jgi:hypothetical protein
MYPLCADVGPVHPTDFMRTRRHPRPEAGPAAVGGPPAREADRVLRWVERNLTAHSHSPNGRDRGPATIDATSCSWGATDLGPSLPVFGKHFFHYGRANRPHP